MTYPHTPGFQSHSDTSFEAAIKLKTGTRMEKIILGYLDERPAGLIGDEAACMLDIPIGTASARLRGLELKGLAFKTESRRLTSSGRKAVVYISGKWLPGQMSLPLGVAL